MIVLGVKGMDSASKDGSFSEFVYIRNSHSATHETEYTTSSNSHSRIFHNGDLIEAVGILE